jgi:O-antigen/teichoic acid export membrane protein
MGDVAVVLALIVVAQALTTAAIGAVALASFRRYPRVPHEPLGTDRPEIVRFMRDSAVGSTMTTFQGAVAPIVLGMVANPVQVGLYRVALAPQNALAAVSSPIRLILLTEQTRDWERGDIQTVLRGVRRFTIGATLLMGVITPPLIVFMPEIVRAVYSDKYAAAGDAARFVLLSSVLLTVIGWSKSLPVSIGRPRLRIWTHGIQALVLLPLTALFGLWWQATGAAAALAVSSVVFAAMWGVIVVRLHREHRSTPSTTLPEAP